MSSGVSGWLRSAVGRTCARPFWGALCCCASMSVHTLPAARDRSVVGCELTGGQSPLPLFVVLREGVELDDALKAKIKQQLRTNVSPHHVPDEIIAIEEVPRTLSGKKLEVPVKKLLMGMPIEKAISMDALNNPQAMEYFIEFAQKMRTFGKASKS